MSASQLAASVDELDRRTQDDQVERFEEALSQMSPGVREAVWAFIAQRIAPYIGFSLIENAVIAAEAPDYFRESIDARCNFYASGAWRNVEVPQTATSSATPEDEGGGDPD